MLFLIMIIVILLIFAIPIAIISGLGLLSLIFNIFENQEENE